MYVVSDKYIEATKPNIITDVSANAIITFQLRNNNLINNSTFTFNAPDTLPTICDLTNILKSKGDNPIPAISFEKDYWEIDKNLKVSPKSVGSPTSYDYYGYVSANLSSLTADTNGYYKLDNTYITINSPTIESLVGLTIYFDDTPCSIITVKTYNGTTEISSKTFQNSKMECILYGYWQNFNKMVISFDYMEKPKYRMRCTYIKLGVDLVFTNEDLVENAFTYETNIDVTSCRLPKQELNFTVNDVAGMFNFNNPLSVYPYLKEDQIINLDMEFKYLDGTKELLHLATLYNATEIKENKKQIQFKGITKLQRQTDTTTTSGGTTQNITNNLDNTIIYDNVYVEPTQAVVTAPRNQLLQQCAQSMRATLFTNTNGNTVISGNMNNINKSISTEKIIGDITNKIYPICDSIRMNYFNNGVVVNTSGTHQIAITNNMLSTQPTAGGLADNLLNIYKRRNEYSASFVYCIEYQVMDIVSLMVNENTSKSVVITGTLITFNGGLKNTLILLEV